MVVRKTGKPRIKTFTSWSFTRKSDYDNCPRKAKLKHLDKRGSVENDAMRRGTRVHALAEAYVSRAPEVTVTCDEHGNKLKAPQTIKVSRLPAELRHHGELFRALRKRHRSVQCEASWNVGKDWQRRDWNDWSGVWLRAKVDLCHVDDDVLVIRDWKTGKSRDSHDEQLDLYAAMAPTFFPSVASVFAAMNYLDIEDPDRNERSALYTMEECLGMRKQWEKRSKPMLTAKQFPPTPNNLCSWCDFSAKNWQGSGKAPCEY